VVRCGLECSTEAREMFVRLGQQIDETDARIKEVDAKLNAAHKASEVSQRIVSIPGHRPDHRINAGCREAA
jgi:hypothetical protein